ncbi:hypothetical protein SEA_SANSA_6 [Microbacterium phage Sansa]|uniref:Uncharacterized protein n=1 Tax=Microbacterium phage Sansa TaxID=2250298 RepID=A0A345KZX7_9CAUD|nr:hypothetical protein SEA_SANSA_6 [Microbacterium phage Sansa]
MMATSASAWIAKRREVKAEAAEVVKANAEQAKADLKAYREAKRTGRPVVAEPVIEPDETEEQGQEETPNQEGNTSDTDENTESE